MLQSKYMETIVRLPFFLRLEGECQNTNDTMAAGVRDSRCSPLRLAFNAGSALGSELRG